jgi:hypothetical protein
MGQRICSIGDCERPHHAKGLCNVHYLRSKQFGRTELLRRRSVQERFWSNVENQGDDCWAWLGVLSQTTGYGLWHRRVDGNLITVGAHRFAYEETIGEIPPGLVIDHLCRNRQCVNPHHLEPVSQRENTLRGVGPSAENARKTHCKRGHKFTPENTYLKPGKYGPQRICRICTREAARRRRSDC